LGGKRSVSIAAGAAVALAVGAQSCSSADDGSRSDDSDLQALLRDGKLPASSIFAVVGGPGAPVGGGGSAVSDAGSAASDASPDVGPIGAGGSGGGFGVGGAAGSGGSFVGGSGGGFGAGGSFGAGGGSAAGGGFGTGGDLGSGGSFAGSAGSGGMFGTGGDFGTGGTASAGGSFGTGGIGGVGGSIIATDGGPPVFEFHPKGRWDFESCNPTRTDLFDTGPNNHTAFRSVSVACTDGIEGQGLAFKSVNDIAYVPDQPDFMFDQGVTVAAWVNPTRVDGVRTILRKRLTDTSSFVLLANDGKFQMVILLKSGRAVSVAAKAMPNVWTHVAATYDNAVLRLYLNGKEAAKLNVKGVISTGEGPVLMGNDIFERRLEGKLDTVVFDTVAMSASDIAALTCLHHPGTVTANPMISPPLVAGTAFNYDLALTNHDTDTCPAQPYFFEPPFAPGFTTFADQSFVTVPAGGTAHVNLFVQSPPDAEADTVHLPFVFFPEFTPGGKFDIVQGEVEYVIAEPPGCHVSPSKELLIRDLSVVEDPMRTTWNGSASDSRTGAWTFAKLMENLSPTPADAPQVVEEMLRSWLTDQTVNGFVVPARPAMNDFVLNAFPRTPDGKLDLHKAPLRLLAIVNRFDLNLTEGSAGEGRFVFGVLDPNGFPLQFTFIVEYQLAAKTEQDVQKWAADWHALQSHPFPSEEYNAALQALTDRFAGRNVAPSRPNGSGLLQVRSNEIALSFEWQLRQFQIAPTTGHLVNTPLPLTPDRSFNFTTTLGDFINANEAAIIAETHDVPATLNGQPFQAGAVINDLSPWFAPVNNPEARFHFSINTCNGCHSSETNTQFLQVAPRSLGQTSQLSPFLTGTIAFDQATGQQRPLNELNRRNRILHVRVCPDTPPPPPPTLPPPFDGGFGGGFPDDGGFAGSFPVPVEGGFGGSPRQFDASGIAGSGGSSSVPTGAGGSSPVPGK
jgi:hypothetical protein